MTDGVSMSGSDHISPQVLRAVSDELQSLEPIFHHPELGTSTHFYERMTDRDFWEVGASGRVYHRDFIIENLVDRYSKSFEDNWLLTDCRCRSLSRDTYLFTYTLQQGTRLSRRSTIWRTTTDGWQALYHQGTLIDAGPDS